MSIKKYQSQKQKLFANRLLFLTYNCDSLVYTSKRITISKTKWVVSEIPFKRVSALQPACAANHPDKMFSNGQLSARNLNSWLAGSLKVGSCVLAVLAAPTFEFVEKRNKLLT